LCTPIFVSWPWTYFTPNRCILLFFKLPENDFFFLPPPLLVSFFSSLIQSLTFPGHRECPLMRPGSHSHNFSPPPKVFFETSTPPLTSFYAILRPPSELRSLPRFFIFLRPFSYVYKSRPLHYPWILPLFATSSPNGFLNSSHSFPSTFFFLIARRTGPVSLL